MSCAGLVPVMTLADPDRAATVVGRQDSIPVPRIKSGSANPAPKLATVIAGMCAGADSIDDLDIVRGGGMKTLFDGVYAPSTIGTLLEFTSGMHASSNRSCASSLAALCGRVICCPAPIVGRSSISIRCSPGLRPRQTGRLLRSHQDRRETGPAQGALPVGHHDQHRDRCPGRRRGTGTKA